MSATGPVVLCILDGWGLRDGRDANAPALAETPNFDGLMAACPHARLITHGPDAGLPEGQMGNSEVGHTNIGAGRVVAMALGQIDLAIADGSFFDRSAIGNFADRVKAAGGRAHLLGVVSDGGVHGSLAHMIAAAQALTGRGVAVDIHAVTDGRDVPPTSALGFLATLQAALPGGARVASVVGRYYAMDRDNRWGRVAAAFDCIVRAKGAPAASAQGAVKAAYGRGETDEFIAPATLTGDPMVAGDGVFCLNFRADRARQIMAAIGDANFDDFDRPDPPHLSAIMGMAEYSDRHRVYMTSVYPKRTLINTLGAWVAAHGIGQFRLAETEKYPHVTFFLNGGREDPEPGEDRFMPPSPKVATYDLAPEMSAAAVTDKLVWAIGAGYGLIVVNYANPDMVGHTGDLNAAIMACEAVDGGLGQALAALQASGGAMLVTADHGNCELMVDPATGGPHTAHTTNPVPVILVGGPADARLGNGRLADLAPTLLALMGLPQPKEMTGRSLIAG